MCSAFRVCLTFTSSSTVNWAEPHGGTFTLLLSDWFHTQHVPWADCCFLPWYCLIITPLCHGYFHHKDIGKRFSGQLNIISQIFFFFPLRVYCLGSKPFNSVNMVHFQFDYKINCRLAHFTNKQHERFMLWPMSGPALPTWLHIHS